MARDVERDVLGKLVDAAKHNDFAEVRQLVSKNDALNKESNRLLANSARTLAAENDAEVTTSRTRRDNQTRRIRSYARAHGRGGGGRRGRDSGGWRCRGASPPG
jgi:hypothetical protein